MPLTRRQILHFLVLGAAAVLVVVLALRNPQPPLMPRDAEHGTFESADACLGCHGPAGVVPQRQAHPLGADCLRCHGRR